MKAEKSLQKFTDSEKRINDILSLEQITPEHIRQLSEGDLKKLNTIIDHKMNSLKGDEREEFYNKIEPALANSTKNQVWEYNHRQITAVISDLMQSYGRMPTKTEIADETGLSRQTVHKHIKEFSNHPQYLDQIEQFKFMADKVLAKVFKFAVNGDMGAAKLYFNVMGSNPQLKNSTTIQNQNNYIQINGTVLSQEAVKELSRDQLNIIESIINAKKEG